MQDIDFESEFWNKVDVNGPDECWEWQAGRSDNKYGYYHGKYAHRQAFEITHGPLGEDQEIRHRCDNPPCCNPYHLTSGTRQDNMRDKCKRGRQNSVGVALFKTEEVVRMRELYWIKGASQNVLAEAFGISQAGVSQIVRGVRYSDLPMPDVEDRTTEIRVTDPEADDIKSIADRIQSEKEKYSDNNLVPEDVVSIRWRYWTSEKWDRQSLAEEYGVSHYHIYSIANGEKWPYVQGPTSQAEANQ